MSAEAPGYSLRITGPAERQFIRLPEGTAAAIVEFMLGALLENPHRLGGALQRELAGMRSPVAASIGSSTKSRTTRRMCTA